MNRKTKILSILFSIMMVFEISTFPNTVIHAKPKVKNSVKKIVNKPVKPKKVLFYTVKLPKMSKVTSKKQDSSATETYYKIPISYSLQRYVHTLCLKYEVPETLVYAVMKVESNYNPNLISDTGDYGVMQINRINQPYLTKVLGVTNYLDFKQNVLAGVFMLSNLYKKYGNINETVMAYHLGEGGLQSCISMGVYSITYSRKVMSAITTIKTA